MDEKSSFLFKLVQHIKFKTNIKSNCIYMAVDWITIIRK